MKFIKITTTHNKEQLEALTVNMSALEIENLAKTYNKFKFVEFDNENMCECMFAVIHENYISELLDIYVSLSLNFVYEDMTREALYGSIDATKYGVDDELVPLLESFIDSNLDVDIVLDKMLDLGKESLTEKDMLVLTKY